MSKESLQSSISNMVPLQSTESKETKPVVNIRQVELRDLERLRAIFCEWSVRGSTGKIDMSDIRRKIGDIRGSIMGKNNCRFIVAVNTQDSAIGIAGFKRPRTDIQATKTDDTVQLISPFVAKEYQGVGAAKRLLGEIVDEVKDLGYKEMIVRSAIRYKDSAWAAFSKMFKQEPRIRNDMYGNNISGAEWRVKLANFSK